MTGGLALGATLGADRLWRSARTGCTIRALSRHLSRADHERAYDPEQVRSKIDHPILDGDGHWVEYDPVLSDKMRKVGVGAASPVAITAAISTDRHLIGAACGLYGFMQMANGAVCTLMFGLIPADPAFACVRDRR